MAASCDACGWLAAIGGMLAFGSFGVPIKSKVAQSLDIDPLVMQTYKTSMCFLTSWLILLFGEPFSFTPWGLVSGLFWVPGGVATVFAIKAAGLAIAIGVGSSFIVLVSFTWGIFIFNEHVHSKPGACLAVFCMMLGLFGMAYFSAPSTIANEVAPSQEAAQRSQERVQTNIPTPTGEYHCFQSLPSEEGDGQLGDEEPASQEARNMEQGQTSEEADDGVIVVVQNPPFSADIPPPPTHVIFLGTKWSMRALGILSAMIVTGVYGGSVMVPMQWAPEDAKGLKYLISFGIGAAATNLFLWIVRYLYLCRKHQSFRYAYNALPSFHFRKMWPYGCSCGLLWSTGNFFSIISVEFLGEGVGYSVVQSSILVSGLWGIFYFHEIKGMETITKWLLSATVTVTGILMLSYEHHEK